MSGAGRQSSRLQSINNRYFRRNAEPAPAVTGLARFVAREAAPREPSAADRTHMAPPLPTPPPTQPTQPTQPTESTDRSPSSRFRESAPPPTPPPTQPTPSAIPRLPASPSTAAPSRRAPAQPSQSAQSPSSQVPQASPTRYPASRPSAPAVRPIAPRPPTTQPSANGSVRRPPSESNAAAGPSRQREPAAPRTPDATQPQPQNATPGPARGPFPPGNATPGPSRQREPVAQRTPVSQPRNATPGLSRGPLPPGNATPGPSRQQDPAAQRTPVSTQPRNATPGPSRRPAPPSRYATSGPSRQGESSALRAPGSTQPRNPTPGPSRPRGPAAPSAAPVTLLPRRVTPSLSRSQSSERSGSESALERSDASSAPQPLPRGRRRGRRRGPRYKTIPGPNGTTHLDIVLRGHRHSTLPAFHPPLTVICGHCSNKIYRCMAWEKDPFSRIDRPYVGGHCGHCQLSRRLPASEASDLLRMIEERRCEVGPQLTDALEDRIRAFGSAVLVAGERGTWGRPWEELRIDYGGDTDDGELFDFEAFNAESDRRREARAMETEVPDTDDEAMAELLVDLPLPPPIGRPLFGDIEDAGDEDDPMDGRHINDAPVVPQVDDEPQVEGANGPEFGEWESDVYSEVEPQIDDESAEPEEPPATDENMATRVQNYRLAQIHDESERRHEQQKRQLLLLLESGNAKNARLVKARNWLAKQLDEERERFTAEQAARACFEDECRRLRGDAARVGELETKLTRRTRERDEARRSVNEARIANERVAKLVAELGRRTEERDEARRSVEQLTTELERRTQDRDGDAARLPVNDERIYNERVARLEAALEQRTKERDEAREAREARLHVDGERTSDERVADLEAKLERSRKERDEALLDLQEEQRLSRLAEHAEKKRAKEAKLDEQRRRIRIRRLLIAPAEGLEARLQAVINGEAPDGALNDALGSAQTVVKRLVAFAMSNEEIERMAPRKRARTQSPSPRPSRTPSFSPAESHMSQLISVSNSRGLPAQTHNAHIPA